MDDVVRLAGYLNDGGDIDAASTSIILSGGLGAMIIGFADDTVVTADVAFPPLQLQPHSDAPPRQWDDVVNLTQQLLLDDVAMGRAAVAEHQLYLDDVATGRAVVAGDLVLMYWQQQQPQQQAGRERQLW